MRLPERRTCNALETAASKTDGMQLDYIFRFTLELMSCSAGLIAVLRAKQPGSGRSMCLEQQRVRAEPIRPCARAQLLAVLRRGTTGYIRSVIHPHATYRERVTLDCGQVN